MMAKIYRDKVTGKKIISGLRMGRKSAQNL